uniref:Uncharacterized protein n=1 Tax=uncultured marine virus TaxID=186617 RepID=A0A0F7L6Q9_9VIRU|nr:hypothetical protein [uncultured marine virus]
MVWYHVRQGICHLAIHVSFPRVLYRIVHKASFNIVLVAYLTMYLVWRTVLAFVVLLGHNTLSLYSLIDLTSLFTSLSHSNSIPNENIQSSMSISSSLYHSGCVFM